MCLNMNSVRTLHIYFQLSRLQGKYCSRILRVELCVPLKSSLCGLMLLSLDNVLSIEIENLDDTTVPGWNLVFQGRQRRTSQAWSPASAHGIDVRAFNIISNCANEGVDFGCSVEVKGFQVVPLHVGESFGNGLSSTYNSVTMLCPMQIQSSREIHLFIPLSQLLPFRNENTNELSPIYRDSSRFRHPQLPLGYKCFLSSTILLCMVCGMGAAPPSCWPGKWH